MNGEARALLETLARQGLRFVVIGSGGLRLRYPARFEREPAPQVSDVDILISPDDLQQFARIAQSAGAVVTSWGEPFDRALRDGLLPGRLYVRASLERVQLDATYENPMLDLAALLPRATRVDEIPVCPERELWASKLCADPLKALRFAREHQLAIDDDALAIAYAALRKIHDEP